MDTPAEALKILRSYLSPEYRDTISDDELCKLAACISNLQNTAEQSFDIDAGNVKLPFLGFLRLTDQHDFKPALRSPLKRRKSHITGSLDPSFDSGDLLEKKLPTRHDLEQGDELACNDVGDIKNELGRARKKRKI